MSASNDGVKGRHMLGWVGWALAIAGGIALAVLLRAFVCESFVVPSGSMLDTIQIGDRLLGGKVGVPGSVSAGDVVTFDDPDQPGTTLIKRVIAISGQTVDLKDGQVYVDGVALDEGSYTEGRPTWPLDGWSSVALSGPVEYPYTVPDGSVWVMGDNRTDSLDSRYFGAVPESSISSKALCIYWPPSDASAL